MSKRGIHSKKAKTRRNITYSLKTKIRKESLHDPIWAETISRTAHEDLITFGYEQFKENFSITFAPDVDCGVVLSDSRGRGVFQT